MAVQYKDGSFGEIKPLAEAIDDFNQAMADGDAKAFHVGTQGEIEKAMVDANVREKLKNFEDRLAECESNNRPSIINRLTTTELAKMLDKITRRKP